MFFNTEKVHMVYNHNPMSCLNPDMAPKVDDEGRWSRLNPDSTKKKKIYMRMNKEALLEIRESKSNELESKNLTHGNIWTIFDKVTMHPCKEYHVYPNTGLLFHYRNACVSKYEAYCGEWRNNTVYERRGLSYSETIVSRTKTMLSRFDVK